MDLLVKTGNPEVLDKTVQTMGAVVGQNVDGEYVDEGDSTYRVRCYTDWRYVSFAIQQQGYGELIGKEPLVVHDGSDEPS